MYSNLIISNKGEEIYVNSVEFADRSHFSVSSDLPLLVGANSEVELVLTCEDKFLRGAMQNGTLGEMVIIKLSNGVNLERLVHPIVGALVDLPNVDLCENILDYGASTDTSFDNAPAIVSAFQANNAVYIPEGIFNISSDIILPSTAKVLLGKGTLIDTRTTGNTITSDSQLTDFTVDGITLDGGDFAFTSAVLDNITWQNVTFIGSTSRISNVINISAKSVTNTRFLNNTCINISKHPIEIKSNISGDLVGVIIKNNTFTNDSIVTDITGVMTTGSIMGLTVESNIFNNFDYLFNTPSDTYISNNKATKSNSIFNLPLPVSGVTLIDNDFISLNIGHIVDSNLRFIKNTFYGVLNFDLAESITCNYNMFYSPLGEEMGLILLNCKTGTFLGNHMENLSSNSLGKITIAGSTVGDISITDTIVNNPASSSTVVTGGSNVTTTNDIVFVDAESLPYPLVDYKWGKNINGGINGSVDDPVYLSGRMMKYNGTQEVKLNDIILTEQSIALCIDFIASDSPNSTIINLSSNIGLSIENTNLLLDTPTFSKVIVSDLVPGYHYDVVVVVELSKAVVYVNDSVVKILTIGDMGLTMATNFLASNNNSNFYSESIGSVIVVDGVLSLAEVRAYYNSREEFLYRTSNRFASNILTASTLDRVVGAYSIPNNDGNVIVDMSKTLDVDHFNIGRPYYAKVTYPNRISIMDKYEYPGVFCNIQVTEPDREIVWFTAEYIDTAIIDFELIIDVKEGVCDLGSLSFDGATPSGATKIYGIGRHSLRMTGNFTSGKRFNTTIRTSVSLGTFTAELHVTYRNNTIPITNGPGIIEHGKSVGYQYGNMSEDINGAVVGSESSYPKLLGGEVLDTTVMLDANKDFTIFVGMEKSTSPDINSIGIDNFKISRLDTGEVVTQLGTGIAISAKSSSNIALVQVKYNSTTGAMRLIVDGVISSNESVDPHIEFTKSFTLNGVNGSSDVFINGKITTFVKFDKITSTIEDEYALKSFGLEKTVDTTGNDYISLIEKKVSSRLSSIADLKKVAKPYIRNYGLNYYVSDTNGSNTNTGESISLAFKTIDKARDVIRSLSAIPTGGICVWIEEGYYRYPTTSLVFDNSDSGASLEDSIDYRNYNDGAVNIVGSTELPSTGFTSILSGDSRYNNFPSATRDSLYTYDLTSLSGSIGDIQSSTDMRVFDGDEIYNLVQYPKLKQDNMPKLGDQTIELVSNGTPDVSGTYTLDTTYCPGFIAYGNGTYNLVSRGEVNNPDLQQWEVNDGIQTLFTTDTNARELPVTLPINISGSTGEVSLLTPSTITNGLMWVDKGIDDLNFTYHDSRINNYSTDDLVANGYFKYGWSTRMAKVSSIDSAAKQITFETAPAYGVSTNDSNVGYFLINMPEELTEPGEYYIDRLTNTLYVYPKRDISLAKFTVSTNLTEVTKSTASYLNFIGLNFKECSNALLVIESNSNSLVKFCEFSKSRKAGITINGLDHVIEHNHFHNIAERMILINGGVRETLTNGNNVVTSNLLDKSNLYYFTMAPVSVNGVGNKFINNTVYDTPYISVVFGGNNHSIEYNHFDNCMSFSTDGGVIYGGRNYAYRGTKCDNNLFSNTRNRYRGTTDIHGVYFDDLMSGNSMSSNVFYNFDGLALFTHDGQQNKINDNIFINVESAVLNTGNGTNTMLAYNNSGSFSISYLWRGTETYYQQEPWLSAYPTFAALPYDYDVLTTTTLLDPVGTTFTGNIGHNVRRVNLTNAATVLLLETMDSLLPSIGSSLDRKRDIAKFGVNATSM